MLCGLNLLVFAPAEMYFGSFIPLTSGDLSAGGGSLKKGEQLNGPSAFLLPTDPEPACTPAQNPEH